MRSTLLHDIAQALRLPWYADKDLAIKRIVDEGKKDIPLVADVFAGRTTFEKAVEPLVLENFRTKNPYAVCRSEAFRNEAKRICEQVKDVFSSWTMDRTTMPHSRMVPLVFFLILAVLPSLAIYSIIWLGTGSPVEAFRVLLGKGWQFFRWLPIAGIGMWLVCVISSERLEERRAGKEGRSGW